MQTTKALQSRLNSLANAGMDKELTSMTVSFGKNSEPAFTFQIDMGRKNGTD